MWSGVLARRWRTQDLDRSIIEDQRVAGVSAATASHRTREDSSDRQGSPPDAELIRRAAELTRDLNRARPAIYWMDLLASVSLGYGALLAACICAAAPLKLATGVVAVLALYRAVSFIHELTHLKPSAAPGFRTAWNLLVGVPLMAPSFMYEGVHTLHHARTRYGTDQDPEYLPLARMSPATLALFFGVSVLAPAALIFRFAVVAPLSAVIPSLRRAVVARASALSINPAFRRKPPQGAFARSWRLWETVTSLWAVGLLASVATGLIARPAFLTFLAVTSGVTVINQFRTLAAHLWDSDGEPVSVAGQYLDSVNVPPPGLLPALWAPVGLRYHALHHLLPGVPYHALAEAHRRLAAALPPESDYHLAHHRGPGRLIVRLATASALRRRPPRAEPTSGPAPARLRSQA